MARYRGLAAGLAAVGLAGCGGPEMAPVSGRVTLDGKPLAGVVVNFFPVGSKERPTPGYPSLSEPTGPDGRFALANPHLKRPGAVVGPHRVSVNTPVPASHPVNFSATAPYYDPLPPKYSSPSALSFEVPPGGTTEANFDLTSDPGYRPPGK